LLAVQGQSFPIQILHQLIQTGKKVWEMM